MTTFVDAESRKRSHTEDPAPVPVTRANVTLRGPHEEESDSAARAVRSRSEYPAIKYWTKDEWTGNESKKKESSDPTDEPGPRGKTRCAQGINVMTTFIEKEDGEPVSGSDAASMRAYARSLWKDFYARGIAPKTWGDAMRSVEAEYERDMERRWTELQFCSNHWKVHQIAKLNYPQWYKYYHKKMSRGKETKQGPPQKKLKSAVASDDDDTGDCQTDPGTDTNPEDSDKDKNTTSPSWVDEGIHEETTRGTSRPRARPLQLGDPL